jgi:hypothetical protein
VEDSESDESELSIDLPQKKTLDEANLEIAKDEAKNESQLVVEPKQSEKPSETKIGKQRSEISD